MAGTKDFAERFAELVKEDKELHDAVVRLLNSIAAEKEMKLLKYATKDIHIKKEKQKENGY